MKLKLISLLFLIIPCITFCQKQVTLYYDIEWKGTDSSNAAYYRLAALDSAGVPRDTVRDYYISGEQLKKGLAIYIDKKNDSNSKWKGFVTSYYRSGAVRGYHNFNKLGKLDSLNITYYESGMVKTEGTYKNGTVVGQFYKKWTEFGFGTKEFEDDFHNGNANGWPLNKNERHICKIVKDSGLDMTTITGEIGVAQALNLPLDLHRNYSISTTIDYKSGDDTLWHGIIWGFSDWDNYNYFYISADGNYRLGAIRDGVLRLQRTRFSRFINQGYDRNILRVISSDRITSYSINKKFVASTRPFLFRGNYVGFHILHGKQKVRYEYLQVGQRLDTLENQTDDSTKIWDDPNTNPNYGAGDNNEFKGWRGGGTGFFIDPAGYIATTYDVVANCTDIQVDALQGGDRVFFKAKLISVDKKNDLAILKIIDDRFTPFKTLPYNLKTETSDVATDVFTLGFPHAKDLGTEVKFTDGKISAKTGAQDRPEWYQMSVPVTFGNGGGALFDYDGNVVGIVKSKIIATGAEDIAYAIKSSYLKSFLESLPENFVLPKSTSLAPKPLTEKIKVLTDYVVMIKVK